MEKAETGKQKRRRIQKKGEKIGILYTNPNIKERGKDLEMLCGRIIRNWEYLRLQREWLQCMKNGNGVIKHLRSFWTQSLHGIGIVWLKQRYIELCCLIDKDMVRDSVFELKNGRLNDHLVPEMWKTIGEAGVDMITNLVNYIIVAEVNSRM